MLLQLLHAVHGLPGVVVPAERDEIRAVSVAEFYQVVVELGHRHHGLATERAALPASYRSSGPAGVSGADGRHDRGVSDCGRGALPAKQSPVNAVSTVTATAPSWLPPAGTDHGFPCRPAAAKLFRADQVRGPFGDGYDARMDLVEGSTGMTDASATRRPWTPRTRSSGSTTAISSVPLRQVPDGCHSGPHVVWRMWARQACSSCASGPGMISASRHGLKAGDSPMVRAMRSADTSVSMSRSSAR